MEQSGYTVQRLHRGGIVEYLGVTVRVVVGEDGAAVIQGWSFPRSRRRKLGYAAERILLASGMQSFCKPHSTNLIYKLNEQPSRLWVENLKPENVKVSYTANIADGKQNYPCGMFEGVAKSIPFWTGPSIDSETQTLTHYIALGADASQLGITPTCLFLKSLDLALVGKGAKRIEVQRQLDK